ncbi:hypothetical protein PM082_009692 [Marasmius tenuissimus]|nr:hypothetical protein PM082_009692 [Marasmius tenuissimus]
MTSRRPFLFILSFLLKYSASFNIEGISTHAQRNVVATPVTTHQAGELANLAFAAVPTLFSISQGSIYIRIAETEQQTGTMGETFSEDEGKFSAMAAYGVGTLPASELQRREDDQCSGGFHQTVATAIPDGCLPNTFDGDRGSNPPPKTPDPTAQTSAGRADTPSSTSTPPNPPGITTTTSTTHTAPGDQAETSTTPSQSSTSTFTPASVSARTTGSTPSTPDTRADSGGNTKGDSSGSSTSDSTTLTTASMPKPSSVPISGNSSPNNGNTRIIVGSVVAVAAAILISLGFYCWRRRRKINHAEETYKRDEDVRALSPYTLAGPNPAFVPKERSGDVPVSYVVSRQAEDRRTSTPEHQGVDQPNMDVYLRLDMISRDLADLRQMMHDSRGVEESLPEYSSQ